MTDFEISVITPARNAAATLAGALESLQAQSSPAWEAVIIDDGSSDATAAHAAAFSETDPRIRLIQQRAGGVSSARNLGLREARHPWVLFLDADDWLGPEFIETMTAAARDDPRTDAVYCDWARVTSSGAIFKEESFGDDEENLFPVFAQRCVFAIHSCVVRRSLLLEIGGFDISLRTCEDWDLWQRVARAGARFKRVRKTLAFYRMRSDSASNAGMQLAIDGLRVIERGHTYDARVPKPASAHREGAFPALRIAAKVHFLFYCAGLIIGSGGDVGPMLDLLPEETLFELNPHVLAGAFMIAAVVPSGEPLTYWLELWPRIEQPLIDLLAVLQDRARAPGLGRRVRYLLEREIVQNIVMRLPATIGLTHAITVEITTPLWDVSAPTPTERLFIAVQLEGKLLGELYLPVIDGEVSQWVIADAIAARFAWTILRGFFEQTIYSTLHLEEQSGETRIFRGECAFDPVRSRDARPFWEQAHDVIGWTILLQELWGLPMYTRSQFYEAEAPEDNAPQRDIGPDEWLPVEIIEELPNVRATDEVSIAITLGGSPISAYLVSPKDGIIRAPDLRALITNSAGLELLRTCVREALVGRPFSTGGSLRARLRENPRRTRQNPATTGVIAIAPEVSLAPGAERPLTKALRPSCQGVVLARRNPAETGTGVSRRARFPAASVTEMLNLAASCGTPSIRWKAGDASRDRVAYVPEVLWKPAAFSPERAPQAGSQTASKATEYFERFFSESENPWNYDSQYEQTKYIQALELLPRKRFRRVIEIGCAEGHFTLRLAPRVKKLIAADIAPTALRRAAQRCALYKHIQYELLDLARDRLPGRFDLIVCSEILYYLGDNAALGATARKLTDALKPGGYLLTAHANLVVDEPNRTGFNWDAPFGAKVIAQTLAATPPLRLVRELQTPLYRILLYRRDRSPSWLFGRRKPRLAVLEAVPAPLPPEVEMQVLWSGGASLRAEAHNDTTSQLPILMYHRVTPIGARHTSRYCVTPAGLIAQMQFLRRKGFYSITLEQWHTARMTRTPLPGRAIILTFDDGYCDFAEHAWPILRLHGFGALIFLVSDRVGKSNEWDAHYGEEVPLMGWDEIRQLQRKGVQFGAHSATHPAMTGLTAEQVVIEAARSRSSIQDNLSIPVHAFAYPYGDEDAVVHHLVEGCGFRFGLSCRPGRSAFDDDPLALRRIEISGDDSLETFKRKLSSEMVSPSAPLPGHL